MPADKRRIRVNAANLRNSHLYVTGLRDFFPPEAIGGPRRKSADRKLGLALSLRGACPHFRIATVLS